MKSTNPALSIEVDYVAEFFDIDTYRVVWHGNYVKYFEVVRCHLLEKIGYSYSDMEADGFFFPVVDLQVRYIKPIRFRQKIVLSASIKEWEHKLVISYLIHDAETGEKLTRGTTTQVAVEMPGEVLQFDSPPNLQKRIRHLLEQ